MKVEEGSLQCGDQVRSASLNPFGKGYSSGLVVLIWMPE